MIVDGLTKRANVDFASDDTKLRIDTVAGHSNAVEGSSDTIIFEISQKDANNQDMRTIKTQQTHTQPK